MTSTALTVVKAGAPIVAIDINNLNYDLAEKWLSTQGGNRTFQGEQLSFNGQEGVFRIGFGKQAQELDEMELVVNVPYLAWAWQEWKDKAPNYPFIALPFAGQALPKRDTLGDLDQSQWQFDKFDKEKDPDKKRRVDPWKEVLVLVCRTDKGRLFHMMGTNITARNAILQLVKDAVVDGKRNHGKLPVVNFTAERIKGDDGNYYVIKTEIVRWVKAEAIDNPGAQMTASTDEAPADAAPAAVEAPAPSRTVAKPRVAKPAAEAAPAAAPAKSRMSAPLEETPDDDGVLPDEEVRPAPAKKRSLI